MRFCILGALLQPLGAASFSPLQGPRPFIKRFGIFPGDDGGAWIVGGIGAEVGIRGAEAKRVSERNKKMASLMQELVLTVASSKPAATAILESYNALLLEPLQDEVPSDESIFSFGQALGERRDVYFSAMSERAARASTAAQRRALELMRDHVLEKVDAMLN
jgi:hypothetical protein